MDFVKKNWGLLAYSVMCLAIAVLFGIKMKAAASRAAEHRQNVEEQLAFFGEIQQAKVKLDRDNLAIAQENEDMVERKFLELRRDLARTYRVRLSDVPTPIGCMNELQKAIRRWTAELAAKEIVVEQTAQAFSFEDIASSEKLPSVQQVPLIMRQLLIVQEMIRLVGEGADGESMDHLSRLIDLRRPLGLEPLEEDLHTITPITITVEGTLDQVQAFINRVQTSQHYLFFLRNVSILAQDQAPGGVLAHAVPGLDPDAAGSAATLGSMMMGSGDYSESDMMMGPGSGRMRPGMQPGMDPGMMDPGVMDPGMMGPGMGSGRMRPGMGMMGPGEGMEMGYDESGMPIQPGAGGEGLTGPAVLDRSELRVFQPRYVQAELRFDLVEFLEPEEEN